MKFVEWKIKESFDRELVIDLFNDISWRIAEDEEELDASHKFSGQVYGLIRAIQQVLQEKPSPDTE